MKTQLLLFNLLASFFMAQLQARDLTTFEVNYDEIRDNLDLRAVASVFGDSKNLGDFENRLNDPRLQLSNLDLDNDYKVDYLRVIESVENHTHVVIIQAVLDRNLYQDVATIDVERDGYNKIHVQVVGDAFIYGPNYIYEPVYHIAPLVFSSFWISGYRPYCSSWVYYPPTYRAWSPCTVARYRDHISCNLNTYNYYNYVNYRISNRAVVIHASNHCNGYEKHHPNNGFKHHEYKIDNQRGVAETNETRSSGTSNRYSPVVNSSRSENISRSIDRQGENRYQNTAAEKVYPRGGVAFFKEKKATVHVNNRNYAQRRAVAVAEKPAQNVNRSRDSSLNRNNRSSENSHRR